MNLPVSFEEAMKELLAEEYDAYKESLTEPSFSGLRVNGLRLSAEQFASMSDLSLRKVPWVPNGFYIEQNSEDAARPARHPYYYAGMYYLQEPSAMTPASRLPVSPGDHVLDLCAAPGGKATELGSRLQGSGVLVANDISASRAAALLKNLELAGVTNIFVTAENPVRLAEQYEGYFDKILVDAPCSGEGMFRRDPAMLKHWQEIGGAEAYVSVQREILESAWKMLRPGGMLLYSTCTFSVKENEEQIQHLMQNHADASLIPMKGYEGFVPGKLGLTNAVRLFPHKLEGEGHFLALLQKEAEDEQTNSVQKNAILAAGFDEDRKDRKTLKAEKNKKKGKKSRDSERKPGKGKGEQADAFAEKVDTALAMLPDDIKDVLQDLAYDFSQGVFRRDKDKVYYFLPGMEIRPHVRYIRTGLLVGTWNGKRFEPSQSLAVAAFASGYKHKVLLQLDDPFVLKYLKGETIPANSATSGASWQIVCVDGFPLGWVKKTGNNLKNKYNPGWRWQ